MVRLVCMRGHAGKPFGVRLRRGKWGPEHAMLTEEECDAATWSPQSSAQLLGNLIPSCLGTGSLPLHV